MNYLNCLPLISVIIPVYNVEKYLKECIESVLDQTYDNIELILVNDGSTDKSADICNEYIGKEKVVVYHQRNNGAASARNLGIDNAHGEFIMFLDGDDWLDNDICSFLYNNIKKEDADISICHLWEHDKVSKTFHKIDLPDYIVMDSKQAFISINHNNGLIAGPVCKLIKSKLFRNIRFVGKCQEDYRVTYQLIDSAEKIVFSNTPKYNYRKRKSSVTHDGRPVDIEWWYATKIMIDIVKKRYMEIYPLVICVGFNVLYSIYVDHFIKRDQIDTKKDYIRLINYVFDNYKVLLRNNLPMKKHMIIYVLRYIPKTFKMLLLVYTKLKSKRIISGQEMFFD